MRWKADPAADGDRREGRDVTPLALGIAALLHAGLLALTPLFPARREAPPLVDTTRGDLFDIEVEPSNARAGAALDARSAPAKEAPPGGEASGPKALGSPAGDARAGARAAKTASIKPGELRGNTALEPPSAPPGEGEKAGPAAAAAAAATGGSPAPPEGSPPGEGSPSDTFSPLEGPAPITGLGGTPAWAIPGVLGPSASPAAAPTAAPAARPVDSNIAGQVLSGSLQKKDHAIGIDLPAGGVVASTIADAVRASEAPPDSRATFEVRLGPAGDVLGVRVVSSSAGNAATWERVAKGAGAALRGRGLSMNGDAASKGATVTVKIESKLVYPAGSKEKYDVQPVCANEVIEELLEGIGTPPGGDGARGPIKDPAVNRPDPSKERADPDADERRLRFCIPIGIKGKGDLSNLGAHMQTVVRSSFKVVVPGSKQLEDVKLVDQRAPWSKPDPNKVQKIRQKRIKKKKKP